ncbi:hypothetical protein ACMWP8_28510, partial [Escherichia coli]|uniref:hypothetical protein n=1 Tax=Escherichia coli TaxID=562 RepID=UPI0039E044D7
MRPGPAFPLSVPAASGRPVSCRDQPFAPVVSLPSCCGLCSARGGACSTNEGDVHEALRDSVAAVADAGCRG